LSLEGDFGQGNASSKTLASFKSAFEGRGIPTANVSTTDLWHKEKPRCGMRLSLGTVQCWALSPVKPLRVFSRSYLKRAAHTANLTEQQRQDIMRENTAKLFNLPAGNQSWRMGESPA
jgi:hypothetical protein